MTGAGGMILLGGWVCPDAGVRGAGKRDGDRSAGMSRSAPRKEIR